MASIEGGCLCRDVRYRVGGASGPLACCHCQMCRKIHGSAFAAVVPVPRHAFAWISGEQLLVDYESSPGKRRWFCPRCGSHVVSTRDRDEATILLRAGCIERGLEGPAVAHGWTAFMAPWHRITDDLPRFERGFPGSPPGAPE